MKHRSLKQHLSNDGQRADESSALLTPQTQALSICSARSFVRDPTLTRSINWISVAFIAYFNVSGGPWGSEEIISSVGPLPGLIGVFVFALLVGLPTVLVTAELSSMYPDDGGYSIWVAEAFGEFWGFQESYWSWISGLLDNALYPVITYHLIESLWIPNGMNFYISWFLKALLTVMFSLPNFFMVNAMGYGLALAFGIVAVPFIVLTANACFLPGDLSILKQMRTGHDNGASEVEGTWRHVEGEIESSTSKDWAKLANILYWNVSGFDCISTCSGEIKDPGKAVLRGLLLCLVMVVITYVVPLAAVASVNKPPWQTWREGSFSQIAAQQVGPWLGAVLIFSGVVGNMGQHVAELFEDTWQLHGMAKCGLAPRLFAYKHPRFKTPLTAVVFSVLLMVVLVALPFERLMMIDNFFSVAAALLECLSFLKLRHDKPRVIRPFRIPVQFTGSLILVLMTFGMGSIVLLSSILRDEIHFIVDSSALALGVLLYLLVKCNKFSYSRQPQPSRRFSSSVSGEEVYHTPTVPTIYEKTLSVPKTYAVPKPDAEFTGPGSMEVIPGTPGYQSSAHLSHSPLKLPQTVLRGDFKSSRSLSDISEAPRGRAASSHNSPNQGVGVGASGIGFLRESNSQNALANAVNNDAVAPTDDGGDEAKRSSLSAAKR
mmetsp:Transcript_50/g.106  ORF Transcript_50/g.106 Transcript_50/m.106 type:complete len:660 (-) Transcript_50:210-2189(-)